MSKRYMVLKFGDYYFFNGGWCAAMIISFGGYKDGDYEETTLLTDVDILKIRNSDNGSVLEKYNKNSYRFRYTNEESPIYCLEEMNLNNFWMEKMTFDTPEQAELYLEIME